MWGRIGADSGARLVPPAVTDPGPSAIALIRRTVGWRPRKTPPEAKLGSSEPSGLSRATTAVPAHFERTPQSGCEADTVDDDLAVGFDRDATRAQGGADPEGAQARVTGQPWHCGSISSSALSPLALPGVRGDTATVSTADRERSSAETVVVQGQPS
jgi:hypothetical protein